MVGILPLITFSSCADEELTPIITFDIAGKGAYIRLIEETNKLINLFDVPGSNYTYSVEFVDVQQGALVSQYILDLVYQDNDDSNGDNSVVVSDWKTFSASDFETSPDGFKSVTGISLPAPEVISAAGTTADAVSAGDNFIVQGRLVMQDGSVHTNDNSSATVRGAAFRGHFNFTLPAACPSDLAGSYEYESSEIWCDGAAAPTGSVDFIAKGGGEYGMTDWSFGGYSVCYSATSVANSGGLTFIDVCNEISVGGRTDDFGDTWSYTMDITGTDWSITWDNTYSESGKGVIKYPGGGDWPLTIK